MCRQSIQTRASLITNYTSLRSVHRESLISPITRTLQRDGMYPLVNIQKAIENGDLSWIYPLKMVNFHSYIC